MYAKLIVSVINKNKPAVLLIKSASKCVWSYWRHAFNTDAVIPQSTQFKIGKKLNASLLLLHYSLFESFLVFNIINHNRLEMVLKILSNLHAIIHIHAMDYMQIWNLFELLLNHFVRYLPCLRKYSIKIDQRVTYEKINNTYPQKKETLQLRVHLILRRKKICHECPL